MNKELLQNLKDIQAEIKKIRQENPNSPLIKSLEEMEAAVKIGLGVDNPETTITAEETEGLSESEIQFLKISKKYAPQVQTRAVKLENADKKVKGLEAKLNDLSEKMQATLNSDELDKLRDELHKTKEEYSQASNEFTAIEEGSEGELTDRLLSEKIEEKNKRMVQVDKDGKPFEDYEARRKREIEEAEQYKRDNDLRTSI